MDHDDRWDDQVRDAYRRPIAGEERAREQVIARLREEPAPRRSRWSGWWMDPDAIRMRPLLAVASLIIVLGIGAGGGAWWAASRGASIGSPPSATVIARPTTGSAQSQPSATPPTPSRTASEVKPSVRAWSPSATRAAEPIFRPTRMR